MTKDDGKRKGQQPSTIKSVKDEIRQALSGQEFGSIEAAQAVAGAAAQRVNRAPLDDFQGLSPDQMQRLIYHPFEADDLVRFGAGIRDRPPATAALLLELLAEIEDGAVLCSHGDIIPDTIQALARRGMEVQSPPDWRKATVWVLKRKGERITKGKVWPPPL